MAEVNLSLQRAFFGIGNANHQHVHRHNKLNMDSMDIDRLRLEMESGGIMPSTLSQIAAKSGEVIARPQGFVEVEDGFNVRRGIGMMDFLVESNASYAYNLVVVFYLHGGSSSHEGLSEDTLMVPVRCWTTETRNTQDTLGMPRVKRTIDSSHQFLMGDPTLRKSLKAVRPIDIGNEAMGFAVSDNDGYSGYSGVAGSDLNNNVMMSKTQNLTPNYYARELLRLGVRAKVDSAMNQPLEMALSDGIITPSIGEIGVTENPFVMTMMANSGNFSLAGFQGYSVGEVANVFSEFVDVLNIDMLNVTNFAEDTTMLTTREYGTASLAETIATEVAMTTVHVLLNTGLSSLEFSASNNATDFGTVDNEAGVVFVPGSAMSLIEDDLFVANRVESFKQGIIDNFFAKYSSPYPHLRKIVNIGVSCYIFGETIVEVSFNEDGSDSVVFSNATYYINHTSTAIAGTEHGLQESRGFLSDLQAYFQ